MRREMMGRVRMVAIAVLACLGGVFAGCGMGRPPVPRAVFPAPRQEMGLVPLGGSVEAKFPLRNDGGAVLHLVEVEAGCGCLTPRYPESLRPGEKGEIRVRFEPQPLWNGKMEKHVKVHTDDPKAAVTELTLVAQVQPLMVVEPQGVVHAEYHRGQSFHREVKLVSRTPGPVTFSNPKSDSPLVRATVLPRAPGDPATVGRLGIDIGPVPGPGDLYTTVKVATSEPRVRVLPVPVAAWALDGPVVQPQRVNVASFPAADTNKQVGSLQVTARGHRIHLLGVDTGNPGLKAETAESAEGSTYTVTLRYTGGWKPGVVQTTLRVRTDDPTFPVVTVPFRVLVR